MNEHQGLYFVFTDDNMETNVEICKVVVAKWGRRVSTRFMLQRLFSYFNFWDIFDNIKEKRCERVASSHSSWVHLFIISLGVVLEHVAFHIKIVDNVFPGLQGTPPRLPIY